MINDITYIPIWMYKDCPRAVSRAQFSKKSAIILGQSRRYLQSVRIQTQSVLPERGRSGVRFPLGPSRSPVSYCPCLPNFCAIVSVRFLTRISARLPACCTGLLPHTLCLLRLPVRIVLGSFFGTRLSVATLKSSFGEQLWGATLRPCSSIDKQLLWRTTALGSSFRKQLWEAAFGNKFLGTL